MQSLFAAMSPDEIVDLVIPLAAVLGAVVVPVVALMMRHQQKMAAFFHSQASQGNQDKAQIDRLESKVSELSDRINQLILVHEDTRGLQARVGPPKLPVRD